MSNQFPTPPPNQMPRVVRVPAASFLKRQNPAVRYLLIAVLLIALGGGGWALWKWQSLHAGMPKLPKDMAELWDMAREPGIEFVDAGPHAGGARTTLWPGD